MLENRLDKFQFKCKEAEKCKMINMKLKAQMQVGGWCTFLTTRFLFRPIYVQLVIFDSDPH